MTTETRLIIVTLEDMENLIETARAEDASDRHCEGYDNHSDFIRALNWDGEVLTGVAARGRELEPVRFVTVVSA